MLNPPGDTSLDSGLVRIGITGTVLLVNSNLECIPLLSPELAYGLVLDTHGKNTVNFTVMTRVGVTTSDPSGNGDECP